MNFMLFLNFSRLLTGKTIKTLDDIYEAMSLLHNKGCKTIVVSSSNVSSDSSKIKCIGRNFSSKW